MTTLWRWGIVTVLALGFGSILLPSAPKHTQPISNDGVVDQTYLQKHYDMYNDAWFGGELPVNLEVRYQEIPLSMSGGEPSMGLTDSDPTHYIIYISPKYDMVQKTALETLIHEMCHVEMFREQRYTADHGPLWQRCMKNLADHDAFANIW